MHVCSFNIYHIKKLGNDWFYSWKNNCLGYGGVFLLYGKLLMGYHFVLQYLEGTLKSVKNKRVTASITRAQGINSYKYTNF